MEDLIKIDEQIASLEKERQELIAKFVGGYDILSIEKKIDDLEEQKNAIILY